MSQLETEQQLSNTHGHVSEHCKKDVTKITEEKKRKKKEAFAHRNETTYENEKCLLQNNIEK